MERRTLGAYDLYRRRLTRRIAIAKSRLDAAARFELSLPETELIRKALIKLGVREDAITVFGDDLNSTYEEAKAAALEMIARPREKWAVLPRSWVKNPTLQ